MAKARALTTRAEGAVNLRRLGMALALYRVSYREQYPPNLETLVEKGFLGKPMYPLLDLYEYVGPLPRDVPSWDTIICYSRDGVHEGGRNVLRSDGSVRWVNDEDLHTPFGDPGTSLRYSYVVIMKAFGKRLTEQRKAELRKFYEVKETADDQ